MHLIEIKVLDLDAYVSYKVLTPAEIEGLRETQREADRDDYRRLVLETIVSNLSDLLSKLKSMPNELGSKTVEMLYNGAVMLNPGIDIDTWVNLSRGRTATSGGIVAPRHTETKKKLPTGLGLIKISKPKFLKLKGHLKSRVIGQDQAIDEVVNALKRAYAGLNDPLRPNGVFIFAGESGIGKTHVARELHKYLYGEKYDLVRIDCGEFQHKHENAKIIGAPPGYVGYDDGGQLTTLVAKQPHTVVLLDEVEKAHPDLWHTFLRVFDEGVLTDGTGQKVSFKDTIIIMTTNLGNKEVVEDMIGDKVGFGNQNFVADSNRRERLAMKALRKNFAPELLNRIDKVVVFNHLTEDDFKDIANLELLSVGLKLAKKGFSLVPEGSVISYMASRCVDSVENARKLSQIRRDEIENLLADEILARPHPKGTVFNLSHHDGFFQVTVPRPIEKESTIKLVKVKEK